MNVRQRRKLITFAAVLVGLAALAVLVAGMILPVNVSAAVASAAASSGAAITATNQAAAGPSRPSLEELQRLCAADLRRPLQGAAPSPSAAAPVATGPSAMTIRLVGTVTEPGHSVAMFQKPDGSIKLCAQGQSVDDAGGPVTVTRIEHQRVTVLHAGAPYELIVPPTPSP